jgi:hypothetical protein
MIVDFDDETWERKLNQLFDFLIGRKLPDGVSCKMPKLSLSAARSVI